MSGHLGAVYAAVAATLFGLAFGAAVAAPANAAGATPSPVGVWMTPDAARIEVYKVNGRLLYQVVAGDRITGTGELSRTRLRNSLKLRSLSGSGLNLEIGSGGELIRLGGRELDSPQPAESLDALALLGRSAGLGARKPGHEAQTSPQDGPKRALVQPATRPTRPANSVTASPPPPIRAEGPATSRVSATVVKTRAHSVWDRRGVDLPQMSYVERAAAAATPVVPSKPKSRPPLLVEKQFMADTIAGRAGIPGTPPSVAGDTAQGQPDQSEPKRKRTTRRTPRATERSRTRRKRAMTAADHIMSGLRR